MNGNSSHAIVVGSGIAGLAAAIRLRVKGYSVEVLEANETLGGKLGGYHQEGFRFDTGPSLFTLPQLVDELFLLAGKDVNAYFSYSKWETACHYFFDDRTFIRFHSDIHKLCEEVATTLSIDPAPLRKHIEHSRFLYEKTHRSFLEKSLHEWSTYLSKDILETIFAIPKLDIYRSMHAANRMRLNHEKLIQIFDRYATYNGSNPYHAPGILNVIPYLELGIGTYFPNQGMRSIPESLIQLGRDIGIKYQVNARVEKILYQEKEIKGVQLNGKAHSADIVVCNADVKSVYGDLMETKYVPGKVLSQEASSSALIFYWGMNATFDQLDLHNIFFSSNYEDEFDQLFQKGTITDDPTVYIHVSSKVSPEDAPKGKENWFVMINVPSNSGQDWNALRVKARKAIIKKLSNRLDREIENLIVCEEYLDPIRIQERTSSYAGALYGTSSNDRMSAFFRHPNRSKVKGLFFAGGSVHPGGGIPLCLLSAKISCSLIPDV